MVEKELRHHYGLHSYVLITYRQQLFPVIAVNGSSEAIGHEVCCMLVSFCLKKYGIICHMSVSALNLYRDTKQIKSIQHRN